MIDRLPPFPRDGRVVVGSVAVFALLSIACAVYSDGFLTADALTHYLYARYAFDRPTYLVDVWGRPLVTALYAGPAALGGRLAVRLTGLVIAAGCAFIAQRIARGQGLRRPVLALVFTLAQPLVFLNSFAEMTELPFAALAGAAFWAYQARRLGLASVLVALTPLARPEGFGLLLMAAAALAWQRKLWHLLVLPLPLLLWSYAGWELYGRHGSWWRWLFDNWPYSANSAYPPGNVLQFVALLPVVVGPFVLPAVLIGAWRGIRSHGVVETPQHLRLCVAATAVVPLGILAVHSLLYAFGKMASYGEPRYLLVAAPFWAVLGARGWEWIFKRVGRTDALRWAAVAALLPVATNAFHPVLPLRTPNHWRAARAFAEEHAQRLALEGYPRVLASHPAVFYYLGVDPQDARATVEWRKPTIAEVPPGTVLVWDPIYSGRNAHADRVVTLEDVRRAGWLPLMPIDQALARANDPGASRRPTPDPEAMLSTGEGWHVFRSHEPTRSSPRN